MDITTHQLRACGIAAGPFFLTVWASARWSTIATIALALTVAGWPDPDSLSVRLVAATAIQFAFLAVVCAQPLAVIGVTRAAPGDA